MYEVEARTKRFFEDKSLPTNAVFAIKFERAGGAIFENYANLYFWKKLRPTVVKLLEPLTKLRTHSKTWSISIIKKDKYTPLFIKAYNGLTAAEADKVKELVAAQLGEKLETLHGRGKIRVLPRDAEGNAIYPKRVAKPKSIIQTVMDKVSKFVHPKKPKIKKPMVPKTIIPKLVAQPSIDVHHQEDVQSDKFKSAGAAELYIVKHFERPANALSDAAWSIFLGSNRHKLPDDFLKKYAEQIERASGNHIGVTAALHIIAQRVALESLDIKEVSETLGIPASNITIVGATVNIKDDVDLSNKGLTKIPYHFGTVTGDFYCINNKLTSLEGCPKEVGESFYCSGNNLTSLEGAPKEVGESFRCDTNNLTSLEGCPKEVKGNFYCSENPGSKNFKKPLGVKGVFKQ